MPRKTLHLVLTINIKSKPFYRLKDNYELTWYSQKTIPDLKHHPKVNSYNKRNNFYIYKED